MLMMTAGGIVRTVTIDKRRDIKMDTKCEHWHWKLETVSKIARRRNLVSALELKQTYERVRGKCDTCTHLESCQGGEKKWA